MNYFMYKNDLIALEMLEIMFVWIELTENLLGDMLYEKR